MFNEILGTEVNVPEKPMRIVSLSPAITEILFMLGLDDRVVGVSAFCARPAEARKKKKFGSYSTVNVKLLDAVETDLIFAITGYQRNLAQELSRSYTVYPLELPVSVAGIVDLVTKVGLVTGEIDKARELTSVLIGSSAEMRSSRKRFEKVYIEIDLGGPVSFGAYSYITDAINLIGAHSIYEKRRTEWLSVDLNSIPKENPDVLIYEAKMYLQFDDSKLEALIKKRGWDSLDFFKHKNYFLAPGPLDFLAHHGPSFITEAMPWLVQKIARFE
jgi:iron complex transport system substrate-binding protein